MVSLFILLYILSVLWVEYRIVIGYRFVNPVKTIAWMMAVFFIPVIGIAAFFVLGGDRRHFRQAGDTEKRINETNSGQVYKDESYGRLKTLVSNLSGLPVFEGNRIVLFPDAESKFEYLFRDIADASRSILVVYYAINDDDLGNKFKDALILKAREGVSIELIYDGYGSHKTGKQFFDELTLYGVKVLQFAPLKFPKIIRSANYRNHKKLVLIDDRISYIGGINLDVVYVNGFDWGIWKDFHMRIEGPCTVGLTEVFNNDKIRITGDQRPAAAFETPAGGNIAGAKVQVLASEPDSAFANNKLAILTAIASAKRSVWIETPYLVPPASLVDSIKAAALSGVEVKIIVPRRSDNTVVKWITQSYCSELLSPGVEIYLYKPGFLHSKIILVDEEITVAGSTNLDLRSLELNHEVNAIIYDKEVNARVREIVRKDMADSDIIVPETWKDRPAGDKFKEGFFRLLSPLM